MGTTKAYIFSDGEIVSEDVYARYSTKAAESKQIPYDKFKEKYEELGLIAPLFNPEALSQLLEISTYHYRAVKTKAWDTVGMGWRLEAKEGMENPSKEQKEKAKTFLENPSPEHSLTDILVQAMIDYEATGDGYIEIIRLNGEVVGLEHIPAHTMRVHKEKEKYCQIRGGQHVWFKRFGLDREIDYLTGEFSEGIPEDRRGNEVIHFRNYTSRSDFYGIPDVLPALGAIMADKERAEYNLDFFENHAVPAYVVTVTGVDLDEDTKRMIRQFFQRDLKESRHSTLVITAQKDSSDGEPIKIQFQPLATEQKDASFNQFRRDNRDEILSAHGVPPYRAGIVVEGSLGGSTAKESTEIYKQSIIKPRQQMIENIINRILREGLRISDWSFKLNDIDTRDKDAEIDRLEKLFNMAVYSPNQILEKLGEKRVENIPEMDMHYIMGRPVNITEGEAEVLLNSLKEFHEKLIEIATKASDGHVRNMPAD